MLFRPDEKGMPDANGMEVRTAGVDKEERQEEVQVIRASGQHMANYRHRGQADPSVKLVCSLVLRWGLADRAPESGRVVLAEMAAEQVREDQGEAEGEARQRVGQEPRIRRALTDLGGVEGDGHDNGGVADEWEGERRGFCHHGSARGARTMEGKWPWGIVMNRKAGEDDFDNGWP